MLINAHLWLRIDVNSGLLHVWSREGRVHRCWLGGDVLVCCVNPRVSDCASGGELFLSQTYYAYLQRYPSDYLLSMRLDS